MTKQNMKSSKAFETPESVQNESIGKAEYKIIQVGLAYAVELNGGKVDKTGSVTEMPVFYANRAKAQIACDWFNAQLNAK